MPLQRAILIIISLIWSHTAKAQTIYAFGNGLIYRSHINVASCTDTCSFAEIGPALHYEDGVTFCRDTTLYGYADNQVFQIDTASGVSTLIFNDAIAANGMGLLCVQDSLLYTVDAQNTIFQFNINNQVTLSAGATSFAPVIAFAVFDSTNYYVTPGKILRVDLADPANGVIALLYDTLQYAITGLTGSGLCHVLIAADTLEEDELIAIDLINQQITPVCTIPESPDGWKLASYAEFEEPQCVSTIDLDCDDSSGFPNSDYDAGTYDCLNDSIRIADTDISLFQDDTLREIVIRLLQPLPNNGYEIFGLSGNVNNLVVSGLGTNTVVISDAGGATIHDFLDALQNLFYVNTFFSPTGGPRIVQVQFTTASGTISNVANTLITVNELAHLEVDLGADITLCQGESTNLDAGNQNVYYAWSTFETTQSITVSTNGNFAVTVFDGMQCPGSDTIHITVNPVINISLTGETGTCQNSPVSLTLNTDAMMPIDVLIGISTGGQYSLDNVIGNQNFVGNPASTTTYEVVAVQSNQPACFQLFDSLHTVSVYPNYYTELDTGLCGGDSIWLGNYWEFNAGVYNIQLPTIHGCDSTILYTIESLPADIISLAQTTCDPAGDGIFITTLPNANGCDTIVQLTVTYVPPDTTNVAGVSCRISQTGTETLHLENIYGCDSIVISGIQYIPPEDTTFITTLTCDPGMVGTASAILINAAGCDSLVIYQTILDEPDSTHVIATTCDLSMVGVTETVLTGSSGCDSIVITTTIGIPADTTRLFDTTCDSAKLGIVSNVLTNVSGCDSIVITTTTYSSTDSTFILLPTCDAAMAGTTFETFTSQAGCDSIAATTLVYVPPVTTTAFETTCDPASAGLYSDTLSGYLGCDSIAITDVALLPTSHVELASGTCVSAEAGIYTSILVNQFGCDSIVTLTVSLLPADTTWTFSNTCDVASVDTLTSIYPDHAGCDSFVLTAIRLFPAPAIALVSVFDFNGFDVSCTDADDGAVITTITGTPPYLFDWSNGDDKQDLENVAAGTYELALTDGNGCEYRESITLLAPPALTASFEVNPIDCQEHPFGSVLILAEGGVPGYEYAVVGSPFQAASTLTGLPDGIHACVVKDANDCEVNGIVRIDLPLMIDVQLGEDHTIQNGESVTLTSQINLPADSVEQIKWYTLSDDICDHCAEVEVSPLLTTTYYAQALSVDGCIDTDSVIVHVIQDKEVYVPNAFSPNGDGVNDRLTIMTKPNVTGIAWMEIFDRWGNIVFAENSISPNDTQGFWDGSRDSKPLNPGVFIYRVVVDFIDGSQGVYQGDVTLIR